MKAMTIIFLFTTTMIVNNDRNYDRVNDYDRQNDYMNDYL